MADECPLCGASTVDAGTYEYCPSCLWEESY